MYGHSLSGSLIGSDMSTQSTGRLRKYASTANVRKYAICVAMKRTISTCVSGSSAGNVEFMIPSFSVQCENFTDPFRGAKVLQRRSQTVPKAHLRFPVQELACERYNRLTTRRVVGWQVASHNL